MQSDHLFYIPPDYKLDDMKSLILQGTAGDSLKSLDIKKERALIAQRKRRMGVLHQTSGNSLCIKRKRSIMNVPRKKLKMIESYEPEPEERLEMPGKMEGVETDDLFSKLQEALKESQFYLDSCTGIHYRGIMNVKQNSYLNAVLQSLYGIEDFRRIILDDDFISDSDILKTVRGVFEEMEKHDKSAIHPGNALIDISSRLGIELGNEYSPAWLLHQIINGLGEMNPSSMMIEKLAEVFDEKQRLDGIIVKEKVQSSLSIDVFDDVIDFIPELQDSIWEWGLNDKDLQDKLEETRSEYPDSKLEFDMFTLIIGLPPVLIVTFNDLRRNTHNPMIVSIPMEFSASILDEDCGIEGKCPSYFLTSIVVS